MPGLAVSVSVTTRPPRAGERDGVDYRFVSDAAFDGLIEGDRLLEWAEVFGSRYGTPLEPLIEARAKGVDTILEIDVQGARQVRDEVPEAVLILLEPPSLAELERRLRARGTEDADLLARRLAEAERELAQRDRFDHAVVNDDVEQAAREVAAIIVASPPQVHGVATETAPRTAHDWEGSPER